jgi:DNA-binding NarL/FixJ family response regulator
MPPESIRLVIVDGHPLVRAGLRMVLTAAGERITVVGEGASGADALRLVAQHQPDVLALDLNLPDLNGIEVSRRLRAQAASTAILILTFYNDAATIFCLQEAGANGYVLKEDAAETLTSAVLAVAHGERWLGPKAAGRVVRRATGGAPAPGEALSLLTPCELEVLGWLAQGLDIDAIAGRLTLTRRTVRNHVSAIYAKLGVASRAEAVLYALRHKLGEGPSSESAPDAY